MSDLDQDKSSELLRLLDHYRLRVHRAGRAQYLAGRRAEQTHNRLGVPVVVLTTLVGTSIFATVKSNPARGWVIAAGVLSFAAGSLSALQTFFRYSERAESHRAAGARYRSIKRELDALRTQLMISGMEANLALGQLTTLIDEINQVEAESPDVPDKYYDRARREQDADEEGI